MYHSALVALFMANYDCMKRRKFRCRAFMYSDRICGPFVRININHTTSHLVRNHKRYLREILGL